MTVNKFQIIPFKGVDLGDIFFELGILLPNTDLLVN